MSTDTGLGRDFLDAARTAPFLERDEEHELAVRWRDTRDERALHRLAAAHMRLVIAVATRFRHYGLPVADLVQEGHVGLLEAAARFDPDREVRFSTYATWWIRAAVQDHVLRNWSIVRGGTSSGQKALFFGLRRLRARLMQRGDDAPPSQVYGALAARLGVSHADVALMDWRLSGPDVSLNATLGEDDASSSERMDFLPDDAPLPDETVGEHIDAGRRRQWLRSALAVLSEREFNILSARRLTDETVTLESLGERLGISKERVRQIENRAIEKLRRRLLDGYPAARLA
jgi:RNA polymerase sigma-32 factor